MYLCDFLADEYASVSLKKDVSELKGKTFFITGANGLIGSNLVNYLYYLDKKENLGIKIIAHSFSQPVDWLPKSNNISYIASDLARDRKSVV